MKFEVKCEDLARMTMRSRLVTSSLIAIMLAGCYQGETDEEKAAGRAGRIECSNPEIIPASGESASTPDKYARDC
jgi:hypothetical protein